MRIKSTSFSQEKCRVEIEVNSREEIKHIEAAVYGAKWVRQKDGKVEAVEAYKAPAPVADPQLEFFWGDLPTSLRQTSACDEPSTDPGLYVQSLSGYDGNYNEKAQQLEEAGFICLRSRRDNGGRFWEIWYLPSAYHAKGRLEGYTIEEVRKFVFSLCPGSIEESGRRWGLVID